MTRSVTIVNTSNWDGEDYEIVERHAGAPHAKETVTRLRPGERVMVNPDYNDIEFRAVGYSDQRAQPFYLTGIKHARTKDKLGVSSGYGQVYPFVLSGVGHIEKPVSG